MNAAKYRIEAISIANFRGFTTRQEIRLDGRHLFLFGPNGYGKSSVVDALRWCLFGSPSGQAEIEVRNTFFPAAVVEVALELTGGLKVRRQLRPGQTGSRVTILDKGGASLLEREAFPQLARLGSPTGTQVIFAAQRTAGRRQTDIADFSRVLYFHLGLEDLLELLTQLRTLREERASEQERMAQELDAFCQSVREDMKHFDDKKAELLLNPPWGNGPIPSRQETRLRIREFLVTVASMAGQVVPSDVGERDLLRTAAEMSDEIASEEQTTLQARVRELREQEAAIKEAEEAVGQANDAVAKVTEDIRRLEVTIIEQLDGTELSELKEKAKALQALRSEEEARTQISLLAREYWQEYHTVGCPACGADWDPGAVKATVEHGPTEAQLTMRKQLQARLDQIEESTDQLKSLRSELSPRIDAERESSDQLATIVAKAGGSDGQDSSVILRALHEQIVSIEAQLADATTAHAERGKRIKDLEGEERFHTYQDSILERKALLESGVEDVRAALSEHESLLTCLDKVAHILLDSFDQSVKGAVQELSGDFSAVFRELTSHPSYDGVIVHKDAPNIPDLQPGRLDLKVTSARRPNETFPTNVLNGQAARALQLVPYFVCSNFWKEIMELDLLLVDDPSESFDTSHIGNLIAVLKGVASHTQLVLASHEEDRIRPLVEGAFEGGEWLGIKVCRFDPEQGPGLEYFG